NPGLSLTRTRGQNQGETVQVPPRGAPRPRGRGSCPSVVRVPSWLAEGGPASVRREGWPPGPACYVQVFSALIVIIAGAFVITIIYRVIQESRREKEVPTEAPVSAKSSVQVETQPPSSAGAGSKAPSVERPQSKESGREDASLIVTEEEETED
uniref:Testis expressed 29 n=1 Tax=Bos taurus TaxID=9913 RepID=A0AAA9RUW2_BOVIN